MYRTQMFVLPHSQYYVLNGSVDDVKFLWHAGGDWDSRSKREKHCMHDGETAYVIVPRHLHAVHGLAQTDLPSLTPIVLKLGITQSRVWASRLMVNTYALRCLHTMVSLNFTRNYKAQFPAIQQIVQLAVRGISMGPCILFSASSVVPGLRCDVASQFQGLSFVNTL